MTNYLLQSNSVKFNLELDDTNNFNIKLKQAPKNQTGLNLS